MSIDIIKQEIVYRGRVLSVRKDKVRFPNGYSTHLDVVEHEDSVAIVPIDNQGQVWFIHQYRHPIKRNILELPAGVVELGEIPEVCAQRELREEIGMSAGYIKKIGGFYLLPGYSTEFMHIYLAKDLHENPLPADEGEIISIEKIPFKKALDYAEGGQIEDAKSLGALLLAQQYFK